MTGVALNWTPEGDRKLLELVDAHKSWVLISANLKRPGKSARHRLAYLMRQPIKSEFDSRPESER
jgi:hypothetical protein